MKRRERESSPACDRPRSAHFRPQKGKKKEKCIEEDMTAIFECVGGDIGPNE